MKREARGVMGRNAFIYSGLYPVRFAVSNLLSPRNQLTKSGSQPYGLRFNFPVAQRKQEINYSALFGCAGSDRRPFKL